ncbi:MAG: SUMF1/EgtB/PvdO family nonheme iron enzyme [Verrucomicrobia bacterium]|nr:SUMF1/EgtB/PvdO family nonheme iron enzyme [Verrucomicrobiota bacterium]
MNLPPFRLSLALLACLALVFASSPHAAEPALPVEAQQRLETLKSGFESFVLKSVAIPYEEGIKALNAKVKPALERESAAAAKRKDLDALVRIKADIERTGQGLLLTDADSPPPDSLKNLYAAYKIEAGKIEAIRKLALTDAKQRYDKGLAQIQDELTAAQNVEGALHVKEIRESLANAGDDVAATRGAPSPALKGDAHTNSLGMKLVPVPGTDILMCIHETRRGDYASYAKESADAGASWKNVSFEGVTLSADDNEPVTMVSWDEAVGFCEWLSKKEGLKYRLPTDEEWSAAVGMAGKEPKSGTPASRQKAAEKVFPWGAALPPPNGFGNYADAAFTAKFPNHFFFQGSTDGFASTAPVMKFEANSLGIYDLGGNVWEWCSDWIDDAKERRVARGGSWYGYEADDALSGCRGGIPPAQRRPYYGFRVVLSAEGAASAPSIKSDMESTLAGQWIFKAGDFAMNKELLNDGTVISGNIPGKWKIMGTTLRVDYANGAWAEFDLPVKDGRMKGKSNKNEDMTAEKIK